MTEQPDLRPTLARTQEWLAGMVEGLDDRQLAAPSGCAEWSVGELVQHLLAVERRIAVLPVRGDVEGQPTQLPLPEGPLGEAFRREVGRAQEAWADDAVLDRELSPPWGTMPGRAVLGGYVQEHLVHGWDLAWATGADGEALGDIAEQVLPIARQVVPAEIRDQEWVPFDPPVEPAADAGATERLANWLGRTTR